MSISTWYCSECMKGRKSRHAMWLFEKSHPVKVCFLFHCVLWVVTANSIKDLRMHLNLSFLVCDGGTGGCGLHSESGLVLFSTHNPIQIHTHLYYTHTHTPVFIKDYTVPQMWNWKCNIRGFLCGWTSLTEITCISKLRPSSGKEKRMGGMKGVDRFHWREHLLFLRSRIGEQIATYIGKASFRNISQSCWIGSAAKIASIFQGSIDLIGASQNGQKWMQFFGSAVKVTYTLSKSRCHAYNWTKLSKQYHTARTAWCIFIEKLYLLKYLIRLHTHTQTHLAVYIQDIIYILEA